MTVMMRRVEMRNCSTTCWWSHRRSLRYCLSRYGCGFGISEVIWWCSEVSPTGAWPTRRRLSPPARFLCLLERRRRSTRDSANRFSKCGLKQGISTLVSLDGASRTSKIAARVGEGSKSNRDKIFSTWLYFWF